MLQSSSENQVAASSITPLGKITGFLLGFLLCGFWGALIGLVVGQMYDENRAFRKNNVWSHLKEGGYAAFSAQAKQATFAMGVIVLGAKMARADGRVSRAEIEAFKHVFRISPSQEHVVGMFFDQARASTDGFESYALRMAQVFRDSPLVLEQVLSGLFIIANADQNGLSPPEVTFLKKVSAIFGFSANDFTRIAARSGVDLPSREKPTSAQATPYSILGISETASAEEIKNTYRALVREHHPDKLMAQGMPEEFIATATEKLKRINAAYDAICKSKGIK